jgi:hypothetical protein
MTIDPPSPLGNAIKSLQAQQKATVESVARVLDVKVGEVVTGTISEISKVSPQTRQTLINAYLEQQAKHPAKGYLAQQPETQSARAKDIAMLQSPKLQLLQVVVKNQKLLTYTDLPLIKNQPVQLLLKTANQLEVVNHAGKPPQNNQPSPQQVTIQQALRASLPPQASMQPGNTPTPIQPSEISSSLQTIQLLNQLTQKLGSYSMQPLLAKNVQEALKNAASQLRTPEQLARPNQLKQALKDSGVQLEARVKDLSSAVTAGKAATVTHRQPASPLSSTGLPVTAKLPTTPKSEQAPASPLNGRPLTPVAQQDLKGALLALLNRLQSTTGQTEKSSGQTPPKPLSPQQNTLMLLLKNLLQGNPQLAQVKQEIPREVLLQQLQQLVQQSLNKIQYRQLQSLSQQLSQNTDTQVTQAQHWHLELPIRYGQEVHTLSLQIDEDWRQPHQEENKEEQNPDNGEKKVRQWFVKLCFELPEAGYFHAHLTIVKESVNASLWAENPATLKKAQEQLNLLKERLNKDGIEVKSLDCFPGKPPQQQNRLGYSLVDIKT